MKNDRKSAQEPMTGLCSRSLSSEQERPPRFVFHQAPLRKVQVKSLLESITEAESRETGQISAQVGSPVSTSPRITIKLPAGKWGGRGLGPRRACGLA